MTNIIKTKFKINIIIILIELINLLILFKINIQWIIINKFKIIGSK